MDVQGASGSSGIPESPILRSALSGQTVRANRPEKTVPDSNVDHAQTSARLATALRRNNGLLQKAQDGLTAARIALESLDEVRNTMGRLLSADRETMGSEAIEQATRSIREAIDGACFGGKGLLDGIEQMIPGDLRDPRDPPARESLRPALDRVEALTERFNGELASHMRILAEAEVERANLFAAAEMGSLASATDAAAALQGAGAQLGPDALRASAADIDPGRVIQIL